MKTQDPQQISMRTWNPSWLWTSFRSTVQGAIPLRGASPSTTGPSSDAGCAASGSWGPRTAQQFWMRNNAVALDLYRNLPWKLLYFGGSKRFQSVPITSETEMKLLSCPSPHLREHNALEFLPAEIRRWADELPQMWEMFWLMTIMTHDACSEIPRRFLYKILKV